MNGRSKRMMIAAAALAALVPLSAGWAQSPEPRKGTPATHEARAGKNAGDKREFTGQQGAAARGAGCKGCCKKEGRPEGRLGMGRAERMSRMAQKLGLTEAQRAEIAMIVKAAQEEMAPLRQQMREIAEKLRQAARSTGFDEEAVRSLQRERADLATRMMAVRAAMRSRIDAVLTPEQRAAAQKWRDDGEKRGPHPHRGPGGEPRD